MLVLSIFVTMLAVHNALRVVLWVALLHALDLPLDFWRTRISQPEAEETIGQRASQTGTFGVFWGWWALDRGPVAPLFAVIGSVAGMVAVSALKEATVRASLISVPSLAKP